MKTVYLKLGSQSLPGLLSIDDVLNGQCVEQSSVSENRSLGLISSAGFLPDNDLKSHNVERMVRKTSERQSRWVIDVAIRTWNQYVAECDASDEPTKDLSVSTGLFLGLGVVDCEDKDAPVDFDGSLSDFAAKMLTETKPLAGLTLLNSTAASHIAQLTSITGVNGVFSPFTDAGAQALIEAFFNVQEGQCEQALVAAGSQKITPWFFLAYREFIQQWNWPEAYPSETATAVIVTDKKQYADACLLTVKRTFSSDKSAAFPSLDSLLSHLAGNDIALPQQLIYTGDFSLHETREENLLQYFPNANLCYLDRLIGYSGSAGALHAVNLSMAMQQQQQGLSYSSTDAIPLSSKTILIIAEGFNGQICYMVVGDVNE